MPPSLIGTEDNLTLLPVSDAAAMLGIMDRRFSATSSRLFCPQFPLPAFLPLPSVIEEITRRILLWRQFTQNLQSVCDTRNKLAKVAGLG